MKDKKIYLYVNDKNDTVFIDKRMPGRHTLVIRTLLAVFQCRLTVGARYFMLAKRSIILRV